MIYVVKIDALPEAEFEASTMTSACEQAVSELYFGEGVRADEYDIRVKPRGADTWARTGTAETRVEFDVFLAKVK